MIKLARQTDAYLAELAFEHSNPTRVKFENLNGLIVLFPKHHRKSAYGMMIIYIVF